MVVKLNNGAVREIKKAEPIVEKRFTFNGDTLRMVAKMAEMMIYRYLQ